jgi:lipopolysaccharide export system permease protein
MLSSGISYRRFIRPYFIAAGILVCTSLLLNHYIVPIANKQKYDFEVKHLRDAINVDESNIHREVEPGTIAYFYKVTPSTQSGSNFSLERWKEGRLVWKLVASGATYFPQEKKWTINNAQIREIHDDSTEATWYRQKMDTTLNLTIDDFGLRKEIMTAMTDSELDAFIEVQRMSGSGRTVEFELEKHNRTANSFSIFVLTLIGVSIASRKQRGGSGVHLMIGIIVGFCNVFVSRFLAVSAITAGFPVLLAAWLPNVIFLFVGLYFYSKAQK